MQTLQFVAMGRQRIEKHLLVEALRNFKILFLSGDGIQVAQTFSHASVFGSEHALHVVITHGLGITRGPLRHLLGYLEGLRVAAMRIHIEIASHDFVDGVKRRPDPLALAQPVKELDRKGAEIAAFQCILTLRQFGHQGVGVGLELIVSGAGIHEGRC